jgi:aminoglycoside phosphotransferase (APT) family kinase protein
MTKELLDTARPVREGEELDLPALEEYLVSELAGFRLPLVVEQFPKGHSNLTYLLRAGDRQLILRRPPIGARIKTAHDMGREYRILSSLQPVYPKAPAPYLYCIDDRVIGAEFYVMDRVEGVILRGSTLPEGLTLGPVAMRGLSTALIDGLAELHSVDVAAADLADFGRPKGYVERQITGWTQRYFNAKTDEIPEVEEAAQWLANHQPTDQPGALIHGDYKYDNLVLDPDDLTRIVAVLDWEMATVGDPLMDLGTTLGYWVEASDPDEIKMLPLGPTLVPGNLTRMELVERYAAQTGRPVDNPLFYFVYGLFKIAVIAQQIYKRFKEGHTKDPRFAMMIVGVKLLGQSAVRAIERRRIYDLA